MNISFVSMPGVRLARAGFLAAVCLVATTGAVPLENWRLGFYTFAAERGDYVASPSGLFWDWQSGVPAVGARTLWPDSSSYKVNHWTLEPALTGQASNRAYTGGEMYNLHFDALSDFKVGPLSVRTALDVDRAYAHDPGYPWKTDRVMAGRIEEAYGQLTGKYSFVRFGRLNRNWGPFPDHSILLSNVPFTYDGLEFAVAWKFFEFRHLFSAFPTKGNPSDGAPVSANRYLTAHALNFIFGRWASAGVSEVVLFARGSGLPDFQYVNPFSLYSVINTNSEGRGNLMLGFQGWAHPGVEKVTLRGQVVFDDFQVDNSDTNDLEPTHWALDVGAAWRDFLPLQLKHHVAINYRYLSKWLYTVTDENTVAGERYSYLGSSLGYPTHDGDRFSVSVGAAGSDFWALRLNGGVTRQDTCTLSTPWPRPYGSRSPALGYRNEESLSKRSHVEKTVFAGVTAYGYFKDFASMSAELESRWVQNENNVLDNVYRYRPRIAVTLTLQYSSFFIRF